MSSDKRANEFPDLEAKLQKPSKQSAFERQKAEVEAKRLREAAETAAVYDEFVKSFDRDGNDDGTGGGFGAPSRPSGPLRGRGGLGGLPAAPGASRRHFGTSALKSGPGSLGPPPSSFGKKRSFQDFAKGPKDRGVLGFEDVGPGPSLSVPKAFNTSDDEDAGDAVDRAQERAIAKPTLRLSNLPPGTSPALIRALVSESLKVENVQIVPSNESNGSERRCTVSIVTLSQETPANDIDAAVNALQNRYLGYGYYLSLHRHLSSAVASSVVLPSLGSSTSSHPFSAKPVEQQAGPSNPTTQHGFQRNFAPPSSYNQPGGGLSRANLLHVPVAPPQDIKIVQAINKAIEAVLEHGPEFEALLMSRPEVQREEKWAWIWDARSQGGIWYRWRLWEVVTGSQSRRNKGRYVPLFDGSHAWKAPDKNLLFEYITRLDEFVSDSEYNSSDEEDLEDDGKRENQSGETEKTFLNPLEKAKLTHLLARLPLSLSRVRKGDIARVTTFAITHASRGVDEVVDMIVSNVEKPFAFTSANPDKKPTAKEPQQGETGEDVATNEGPDVSAASLVGLYVVSDILSSSSTSGVRHAWRFRQLFETALRDRKVFETLGLMSERLKWGRLRSDKWKRSVGLVLNFWEGWCVFPVETQELFVKSFEKPPSPSVDDKADEEAKKGKWKAVEKTASAGEDDTLIESNAPVPADEPDVEGEPIDDDDITGEPIAEDDVEGEPIEEDDVEGEPMEEDDIAGEPMEEDEVAASPPSVPLDDANEPDRTQEAPADQQAQAPKIEGRAVQPRRRMRAVDLFADSDDSDKQS